MESQNSMPQKEIIDLLNKCWMTHDGMWFFHCLKTLGMEETNRLNKAAIKSLAPIEIKRLRAILGNEYDPHDVQNFNRFLQGAARLMIPDFMNLNFDFPDLNTIIWKANNCFAYVGIKRLGVIDTYECGVLHRIHCWLEALGIQHQFNPGIGKYNMHYQGRCEGRITLETI